MRRTVDEVVKRGLYERMGVRDYWVVDPLLDTMSVYRRIGEALRLVAELSAEAGDVLTAPLLPGLSRRSRTLPHSGSQAMIPKVSLGCCPLHRSCSHAEGHPGDGA